MPTDAFFPDKIEDQGQVAEVLFERVRKHAGMEDWPCELVAQEADIDGHVHPGQLIPSPPSGPAGTYSVSGPDRAVTITYNPSLLGRPEAMIATFAHELAHYLAHSVDVLPPGGEDFEEHATDLLAVVLGFGVFLANSAFTFEQYTDNESMGWSAQQQGYLSETQLTYALAVFVELKMIDPNTVEPYLDRNLRKFYRKCHKELGRRGEEIEKLRAIRSYKIATPAM